MNFRSEDQDFLCDTGVSPHAVAVGGDTLTQDIVNFFQGVRFSAKAQSG